MTTITSAPPGTYVQVVHEAGSGRVRLRVAGLYRSERFKSELENTLIRRNGVEKVSANVLTGNLLLEFDLTAARERILAEVENLAMRHSGGRSLAPARQGKPKQAPKASRPEAPAEPAAEPKAQRNWFPKKSRPHPETAPRSPLHPSSQPWHVLAAQETLQLLETGENGLSCTEAARRLHVYGPNRLAEHKRRSPIETFAGQLANAPMAMLGVSAAVSLATGGVIDAAVIVSTILLNSVIGYLTESASERTINSLGSMTPTHARVIRDGKARDIPVDEVVIGDLLLLSPGTYISADARLLTSSRLSVDESALTGESLPVGKRWDAPAQVDTPLADRKNMLHMGTLVTGGSARAVVVGTGNGTEIGLIQSLVGNVEPPDTLLQRQLDDMGKQLAIVTGGLCVAVAGIGLARGYGMLQMVNSAISLAVAAIPEGLPAVATTTLAIGIRNMHREKVLIRQLPAVESLGSVRVICLDKTGTLTLNRMKVVNLQTDGHLMDLAGGRFLRSGKALEPATRGELVRLLETVCLCSEVKLVGTGPRPQLNGSPTECALIEAALDAGVEPSALRNRHPLLKTVYRAEKRPYMVTVHETPDGRRMYAVKGSPAEVLRLCDWRQTGGEITPLDEAIRDDIFGGNERMAGDALRVLGVAYALADAAGEIGPVPRLIWLGLIGMEDSIRPGVDQLMHDFHKAGVRTVMITGDQSATAYSVGSRLNLSEDGPLEIIDSSSLDKLDPEILRGVIHDTSIFARVSPAHKLKIVQALQEAGHVVAMTGDGINDGPALKAADIGVAMGGQGTDVARSVADVVLEDDNLQTMIAAIRQGRTIYSNIRKSLRFLLATNLSEIELMVGTMAIGWGEALNPLQLLWINMVADIAPALALALEPPEREVMEQPPRDPNQPILDGPDQWRLLRESLIITGGAVGVYGVSRLRHGPGIQAGTNTFMAFTLSKMLHALSCRSEDTTVLDRERPANPHMGIALAGTLALQVLAATVPQLRTLLRTAPLIPSDLLLIAAGAGLPFLLNEAVKGAPRITNGDSP